MIVWEMFLIPVSLAVTAVLSDCTPKVLDEPPDKITVLRGSSLTLFCSGTCQGETSFPIWLRWHFTNVSESNKGEGVFTCNNESSGEKTWCNYTRRNVHVHDSGWYYCKVTFDRTILLQKESRRTRVDVGNKMDALVTAAPGTETPDFIHPIIFIVSGVSVVLLILLVVMICVVQRRRQRRRHKELTCPVYGNTRPPSATRRQKTSKPDTLCTTGVPQQAETPLKEKC